MVTEYSFRLPWLMSVGLIWCQDVIHQLKLLVFLLFLVSEYDTIHDSCVGTSIAAAIILLSSMANRLLLIDETNVLILIFSDDDEWRAQISG